MLHMWTVCCFFLLLSFRFAPQNGKQRKKKMQNKVLPEEIIAQSIKMSIEIVIDENREWERKNDWRASRQVNQKLLKTGSWESQSRNFKVAKQGRRMVWGALMIAPSFYLNSANHNQSLISPCFESKSNKSLIEKLFFRSLIRIFEHLSLMLLLFGKPGLQYLFFCLLEISFSIDIFWQWNSILVYWLKPRRRDTIKKERRPSIGAHILWSFNEVLVSNIHVFHYWAINHSFRSLFL